VCSTSALPQPEPRETGYELAASMKNERIEAQKMFHLKDFYNNSLTQSSK
jgi:hypothetical protein